MFRVRQLCNTIHSTTVTQPFSLLPSKAPFCHLPLMYKLPKLMLHNYLPINQPSISYPNLLDHSHLNLLDHSHFNLLDHSHFNLLDHSHFNLLDHSHFNLLDHSHFNLLDHSHFNLLDHSHFNLLDHSHFVLMPEVGLHTRLNMYNTMPIRPSDLDDLVYWYDIYNYYCI